MGHTRLGDIPTGRKWKAVVAALASLEDEGEVGYGMFAEDVALLALKTLEAAKSGLSKALDDNGLQYTFFLLTQVALASREDDWRERLSSVGINVSDDISPFTLTSELHTAIDDYLSERGHPTDISEIAQQAAGEAITSLTVHETRTLFGAGEKELQTAIRHLSTKRGFADLGQRFFGRFMARFLNFYLSRATAANVGGNKLPSVGDVTTFNNILQDHCEQTARVVRDYCGEWYSKTKYIEGINLDNTSRFMTVALKKLQSELEQQRKKL